MHDQATHAVPVQSVTLLLGSPFSGSSLLGQSLNDIAGIAYAGELDRLHRFGFPMHLASNHHRSHCEICTSHEGYSCPAFPLEHGPLADPADFDIDGYAEVLSRFSVPHVVDGSKNVDWLWYLHGRGLLDVLPTRVILVSRSVWAFAASQVRTGNGNICQAAEGWRNIYRHALRSLSALSVPVLPIRHEAFVGEADKWLSRAAWFVSGQPHNVFEPKALHCIGGNVSAFSIREEFDQQGYLRAIPEDERTVSRRKFEYFGSGTGVRTDSMARWAKAISREDARSILALPGVMETMLDLGYDPLRMLDEHAQCRAAMAA